MEEQPKHFLDGAETDEYADSAATVEVADALTAALPEKQRKEVANNPLLLKLRSQEGSVADAAAQAGGRVSVAEQAEDLDFTKARSKRPKQVTAVASRFVNAMRETERRQVKAANPVLARALQEHEAEQKLKAGARKRDPNIEPSLAA